MKELYITGPFLPCDDLFGWWSLRCGVWIVFLLAVLGNGAVLLVSITSKSKMDVTRFLICNLALSDLFMGIYLGFLAIVDASSLGEFEMYAVRWQSSAGCLIAGFLGVLSSELSVYTLVIITIERFYAISNAMQLDKRLRLRQAGILMAIGWFVCLSIACLPLFEVSDYRKFAICLPFETENDASLAYVCFIMIFNAVSFLIIVICYTAMFISIRGSHSWNSNDTIVAKRMALLVFTDFFCWAPIIFCSLTAAFGVNFAQISVNEAKILTIFVLPLNSCANPFLYAFFTRQFKRDCVKLCQRIEEASISRHLQGSGGVRASFAPNRYHSQGSTYRFKNASCGHSNQEASTSGEASYSNSDTELNVKKLPDTEEHILKYVRSDSGIFVDGTKSVPFSEDVQIIDLVSDKPEKKHSSPSVKKIKLRKDIRQDFDSGPDIVLHTKEGHILFKAKKKSLKAEKKNANERSEDPSSKCAKRLCYHSKTFNSENINNQNNNVEQVEALVEPKLIEDGEMIECDTSTKQGRQVLLKQKFESERSEDLGLKVKPFKAKKTHPYKVKGTGNKSISIPTKTGLKLRKVPRPELPSEMNEKDKQINEWRKSSHLSYLCKGLGNYNSVAQKQKSNSLVELTRLAYDWKIMSNKRHSLSSRHEGYLLLKNRTRDSVYDDEDLYEFHKPMYAPRAGLGSLGNLYTVIQGCETEPCNYQDFSIDGDDVCETAILLPVSEKSSKESRKVNSCESGISSSS